MSNEVKPFIGPHSFEESDSPFFYGRDKEIQEILALILSASISLIYSKSGLGKTSIFNAKIIPELKGKKYKVRVLPITRFKTINTLNYQTETRENNFNMYVFNTLLNIIEKDDSILENENLSKEKLLNMTLSEFIKEYDISQKEKYFDKYYHNLKILIFDQFEEFFNFYSDDIFIQQRKFFYQIRDAINNDPNLRIVFIMREEFIASLDTFSYILPDEFRRRFRLEPLDEESAKYAVEKPLLHATILDPKLKNIINESDIKKIANKVVENLLKVHVQRYNQSKKVMKDSNRMKFIKKMAREFRRNQSDPDSNQTETIRGKFVEPVQLQVVCLKLWENKILTGKIRNEIDNINLGDVDNALNEFYVDAVITAKDSTKTKEHVIREWCEEQLITSAGYRNIVYQDVDVTAGLSNKVVNILQNKYLIRTEERAGSKWCELTHDRLIKPIKDSNKSYADNRRRKNVRIIKILVPILVVLPLVIILTNLSYFENLVAENQNIRTMIDREVNITLSSKQANNSEYTYLIMSQPRKGTLHYLDNDTIGYNPDHHYVGHDGFSYVISNGKKNSNIGSIDINVSSIPLKAINQTVVAKINSPTKLSLIDWDYNTYEEIRSNGTLPIIPLYGPFYGYLVSDIRSNTVIYNPIKNFEGEDFFLFCLPKPENTTRCSDNQGTQGIVDITTSSNPKYYGYLMIDNGLTDGTLFPIYATTNTIGRSTTHDNPDIPITDNTLAKTVSRLHGKILFQNNSFILQDTEGLNKIIFKGKQFDDRQNETLQPGDTFDMGGIKVRLISDLMNSSQYN